jgi:hypothetical protein
MYAIFAGKTFTVNNWQDAVTISPGEREMFMERVVNELRAHPEKTYTYILTGDMLIVAFRAPSGRIEMYDTTVQGVYRE